MLISDLNRFLIVSLTIFSLNFGIFSYTLPAFAVSQTEYNQQKTELENQISSLDSQVQAAKNSLFSANQRKQNLKLEKESQEKQIADVEQTIIKTDDTLLKISQLIKLNEEKLNKLEAEISSLFRDLQTTGMNSPLEVVITSQNIGDALSNLYNLSQTQNRALNLQNQHKTTAQELLVNQKNQQKVKEDSEQVRLALVVKKEELSLLIQQTQMQESEYQKLLQNQQNQQAEVEKQLANLPKPVTQIPGGGGSQKCWFTSTQKLPVGEGFFVKPTQGVVSDIYGCPPWSSSWRDRHDGVDISAPAGTPIVATATGIVAEKTYNSIFGNHVIIKHTVSGTVFYSLYAHMESPGSVSAGQIVNAGQQVGVVGNTGNSFGAHLHFMLISDEYSNYGPYCAYSSTKCFDPIEYGIF